MDQAPHILIIEDDDIIQEVLRQFLGRKGFDVTLAANGEHGLDMLRTERFDLILTDLVMPGLSGMDVLKELASAKVTTPVVVITAFGTVQTAVEAMKNGAFDYLTKPFNLDELMLVVEKALSISRLQRENAALRLQLRNKYDFTGLIGDSAAMQKVLELIERIADTDSTVLITGESGTGKELVAKTIHYNSATRANGPFIALSCAAIPRDLIASELFGHEKGAFTGAVSMRPGRFELAQGGTLFLDEIGELDPALQVKLLRVLQEREFVRVGGVKTIKVDVRIIAATNKNLEQATKDGSFREDLFYRLNVIPLHLPPLRDRKEDIPLLIAHFIQERKRKREPYQLSSEAAECLKRYPWPGNVRELENLIERVTILTSGATVELKDLPEKVRAALLSPEDQPLRSSAEATPESPGAVVFTEEGIRLNDVIADMERSLILTALERSGGVRTRAARLLGLNRTTLLEKMKKMGIGDKKQ